VKARKKEKICCFGDRQHAEAEKVKVLTHRSKHAKMAKVLKPAEGSSASGSDCPALAEAKGMLAEVTESKVITEQHKTETTEVPKRPAEARAKMAEEPESKKSIEQPKILNLPQETELPKVSEIPAVTCNALNLGVEFFFLLSLTKFRRYPFSFLVPSLNLDLFQSYSGVWLGFPV
jgi:hypothetical protein